MRAEWFDFQPTFKVWLATNHKPEIRGTDPAIRDRVRHVPFTVRIADDELDPQLPSKLLAELPGILAWAVRGCIAWQQMGLGQPESVRLATAEYRAQMDTLAAFFSDRCLENINASASAKALYEAYKSWCADSGEKPETQKAFGPRLTERGFGHRRTKSGWQWLGVGLVNDGEPYSGMNENKNSHELLTGKTVHHRSPFTPQGHVLAPSPADYANWLDDADGEAAA